MALRELANLLSEFPAEGLAYHKAIPGAKPTEESQRKIDQWLRLVLKHSDDGINISEFDLKTRRRTLVLCNDRFVQMSGRSLQELMNSKNLNWLVVPYGGPRKHPHRPAMVQGKKYTGCSSWIRPDGKENYYDWASSAIRVSGKTYIIGIDRDITKQMQAEQTLRESEATLRALLNASSDRALLLDSKGVILACNETAAKALNTTVERLIGRSFPGAFPRPLAIMRRKLLAEVVRTGQPIRMRDHRDGRDLDVSLYPVADSEGKVCRVAAFARDITDQRTAEKAVRESEQRYRELFESAPICILEDDHSSGTPIVRRANRMARQTYGWTQEQFIGMKISQLVAKQAQKDIKAVQQAVREGKPITITSLNRRRDGTVFPVRVYATALPSTDLQRAVIMVEDITGLKQAEEALRRSEEGYRGMIESQREMIVRVDLQNRFTFVNDAYCRIMGKSRKELLSKTYMPLVHPEDLPKTKKAVASLFKPPYRCSVEQRAMTAKGWRWIAWEDFAIRDERGKIVEIQAVGRDITTRKEAEETLRKRQQSDQYLRGQLVRLHEVADTLTLAPSFDELCRQAVELGRSRLGYDRMGLWFVIPGQAKLLQGAFGTDELGNVRDERETTLRRSVVPLMDTLINKKKRFLIRRNVLLMNHQHRAVGRGDSLWSALTDGKQVVGVLTMDNLLHKRPITTADCEVMKLFASKLGHLCSLKRAEEALRRSEELYRAIVEDQTELICRFQPDGVVTFANEAYCNYLGMRREEVVGKSFLPRILKEDRTRLRSALASLTRTNPVMAIENRALAGGQLRWTQWTERAIFDARGAIVEYQAAGRDVTDRKRAEEALQGLHNQLMNAAEIERRRLARDLHDSLGQQMIAMNYSIRNVISQIPNPPAELHALAADCRKLIREVREISHDLFPATLESLGLAAGLRQLAGECRAPMKILVRIQSGLSLRRYATAIEIALFRIAQEALHNCLRHSNAKKVTISLSERDERLTLQLQDDGCGFDVAKTDRGMGLSTMKERARSVGGKLTIVSGAGKTRVIAQVQLSKNSQPLMD